MKLRTKIALGILAILTATNVNYVVQRQQAFDALKEVSALTEESSALDSSVRDKARYEKIIASIDQASSEIDDLRRASRFGQPAAFIDEMLDNYSAPQASGILENYGGKFAIYFTTGVTSYIYVPDDSSGRTRQKGVLDSARESYTTRISEMKWDVEYLPPTMEAVLDAFGITFPLKEAVEEAKKPHRQVPAMNSAGKIASYVDSQGGSHDYSDMARELSGILRELGISVTQENVSAFAHQRGWKPVTQAEVIQRSAYFVPYLNKPIPFEASPEPVDVSTFSFAPFPVDTGCLEQRVGAYNGTFRLSLGTGIAPRVEDGMLYGFAVWAEIIGGGYPGMNEDILNLGKACEVAAK